MKKRILITGGTGFVGANLARHFLQAGHDIHLLVREGHQAWRLEEIHSHIALHTISLLNTDAIEHLLKHVRPDWIFHLATQGAYSWQNELQPILETNILGTANLLQAATKIGVEAFINTGSSSEYGHKPFAPAENTWVEPNSYYAVSKVAATLLCRHMAQQSGMNIPTLRLYSVYGPYEEPNRLMPSVIVRGLHGTLPPLAHPDIARDYIYIDDVIDAFQRAATTQNQELGAVYNVGTGVQTTLEQVITTAQQQLPILESPNWGAMENRAWDTNVWVADNRTIQQALGWKPLFDFETGFLRSVEWFENTALRQRVYEPQYAMLSTSK